MTAKTEYEPFATIIQQGLAERRGKDAMDRHPEHNAPRYVVWMCDAMTRAIHDAGNEGVTLADVVRLESTCTGADYHHKFAMRCHHLALRAAV
ncbi:hypothetical protein HX878_22465 [Pseudomonas veronii]|uniref:hypothetical protein n=1 Tax=Pseudomonas veronii TaxID=76761 RepID=UPI0015A0ADA3|nr:hypothetical protein [Pseudomonas veronii]NWD57492.1 hypothetical protein [Pseudomonas veronii]